MLGFFVAAILPAEPDFVIHWIEKGVKITLSTGASITVPVKSVRNVRHLDVQGVQVMTWEDARGEAYAISADGKTFQRQSQSETKLQLKYRAFDPLKEAIELPKMFAAREASEAQIIQFVSQPLFEYQEELRNLGVEIHFNLVGNACIARVPSDALFAVASLPFVRTVSPYHPAFKTESGILQALQNGSFAEDRMNIQLMSRTESAVNRVTEFIEMLGGDVLQSFAKSGSVTAKLNADQLTQLLAHDDVSYVDRYSDPEYDMDICRQLVGAVYLNTPLPTGAGLNLLGQGIVGAVMDNGLRTSHLAFNATGRAPILQNAVSTQSHGTSTYGINFGDGDGNASGIGLLPLATGVFATSQASAGVRYPLTQDLLTRNAVYQSNSWGSTLTSSYTTISAEMDTMLFDLDITLLQSQSNNGNTLSRPQAWSKNIVSIGGAFHFNTLSMSDDRWNGGASTGPAADGRIKPDLCNAYDQILTTTSTNDTAYTSSFGGTSGATPITAGSFGLMFQMWGLGFFGNSCLGATHFANRPTSRLAKALMINTAKQYSLVSPSDLTRVRQGWGMVDLQSLHQQRGNVFYVNETAVLNNLDTHTYRLYVPAGQPSAKFTMTFKDPAGSVSSVPARVNNLSLKVTAPNGSVYWGNAGLSAAQFSATDGSEDLLNTVENVFIELPQAGVYTVQVIGSDINTDIVPSVGGNNATYALVASGVRWWIQPNAMTPSSGSLVSGNLASLVQSDNDRLVLKEASPNQTGNAREVVVNALAPMTTLSQFQAVAEVRMSNANPIARMDLFNFSSGTWTTGVAQMSGTSDGLLVGNITAGAGQYIDASGNMRARVLIYNPNKKSDLKFTASVDQVKFLVQP
jgi:serine protease AprX